MRLNARSIGGLKLPSGKSEKIYWDSEIRGFGFRLRGEGDGRVSRTFITQYRISRGRQRRMTLGDFSTLTFEQARGAARAILAKVSLGQDPAGERQQERLGAARSLRAVIDSYLAAKAGQLRPNSLREARRYLTGPYFKPLFVADIKDIGRADVAMRINAVTRDNGPIVARAARAALAALFVWSMRQGLTESNPVIGTGDPGPANGSRERVLSDSELVAVWRHAGDDDYGKIVRLLICIPCRRQEIGALTWNEVDCDNNMLVLSSTRTKNKRELRLPLLPLAQSIIDSVPERDGRDFLFGDRSSQGFTAWSKFKGILDKRVGNKVAAPWGLHDLRRTAATWLAEHGNIEPHIIEAVLGHFSGHRSGVHGVYNRAPYERQIKNALLVWNDHLRSLISGGGKRKILSFPQPVA
jgi:integrase